MVVAKSNRDLISDELSGVLAAVAAQHAVISADDAALRVKRDAADVDWRRAQNLRLALFALDGEAGKTVSDADAANEQHLDGLEG